MAYACIMVDREIKHIANLAPRDDLNWLVLKTDGKIEMPSTQLKD